MGKTCLKILKFNFCNTQKWQTGFFLLIPIGWGEVRDYIFPEGGSQCKILGNSSVHHTPFSPLQCMWQWTNQTHWKRPIIICFHCPVSCTDLEILAPSKPTHFNEPWPTGMTESFSHVDAATAGPGRQKMPPPQDTTLCPVTTTWDLNTESISPAVLSTQEKRGLRGEQEAWRASQSWTVLEESPAEARNGQGRGLEARAKRQT